MVRPEVPAFLPGHNAANPPETLRVDPQLLAGSRTVAPVMMMGQDALR
jgi:hypothetical protein